MLAGRFETRAQRPSQLDRFATLRLPLPPSPAPTAPRLPALQGLYHLLADFRAVVGKALPASCSPLEAEVEVTRRGTRTDVAVRGREATGDRSALAYPSPGKRNRAGFKRYRAWRQISASSHPRCSFLDSVTNGLRLIPQLGDGGAESRAETYRTTARTRRSYIAEQSSSDEFP